MVTVADPIVRRAPSWLQPVPGILLLAAIGLAGKVTEQAINSYGRTHQMVLPNIEYVLRAIVFGRYTEAETALRCRYFSSTISIAIRSGPSIIAARIEPHGWISSRNFTPSRFKRATVVSRFDVLTAQ